MKKYFTLLLLSFSFTAVSQCNYFIENNYFYYQGHDLSLNFEGMLAEKNYIEVGTPEEADFLVDMEGFIEPGKIHKGVGYTKFGTIEVFKTKLCFTQLCRFVDVQRALQKSFKTLSRKVPNCKR